MQAAAALLSALFTVLACYAAGVLLLDRLALRDRLKRGEQVPIAFLLGASVMHLAIFVILSLHIAYKGVLVAALVLPILVAIKTGCWRLPAASDPPLPRLLRLTFGLGLTVFLVLYGVNALAPESSPDGSSYHLGFVAQYLRARGFERVDNMYAALSGGIEMLFVPAFALGRHSAAALVHFSFALALALAILAYGRRIGHPNAGAAAALLVFVSPVVGRDASSAYVDAGVAAIVFGAFYCIEIWNADRNPRWLIAAGLLAGYSYAAKYTAAVILIYVLGFVAMKTKQWKPLAIVAACAAVMIAPWMIRNWIWYQNPVAPMANALFPNRHFYILAEQSWAAWLRGYDLPTKWALPLEVTIRGFMTSGIIGPIFLLAPLALASLRFPAGRHLLAAAAIMLTTYPANLGTRFLIPTLPFVSMALAMALDESRAVLVLLMVVHSVASWPNTMRLYADSAWRVDHFPWKAALRIETQDGYLRRVHYDYVLARMVEDNVPPGESVLTMSGLATSYTSRIVHFSFQSSPDLRLAEIVNMGWSTGTQATRAWLFHVEHQKVHHIRVVQTQDATYPQQWNVHEIRIFSNGQELARRPEWRITASPNRWDAPYAFDNSEVTRWRSWETARAGMYIEADFGHDELVDEVRVETSADIDPLRLRLDSESNGSWRTLNDKPELTILDDRPQIRREAIREMHLRGVNYLLIQSGDFGASDYHDDPGGWGLKIVAETPLVTLYRSIW